MTSPSHPDFECEIAQSFPNSASRTKRVHNRTQSTMLHLMRLMKDSEKSNSRTHANTPTIELIGQLFHAILNEDGLDPLTRLWFARLQTPVVREALIDPAAFHDPTHPARRLITRISACALGLSDEALPSGVLEQEIKRLVLLIERFPIINREVFELANHEFDGFLTKFRHTKALPPSLADPVQQTVQMETLTVQYQIALLDKLSTEPVQAEIRDFLHFVWAIALATQAVREGLEHVYTLELKRTAVDLIQINTALLRREERHRAIGKVPPLIKKLRHGMTVLGLCVEEQDQHVKKIGANLTDSFLSVHQEAAANISNIERRSSKRISKKNGAVTNKNNAIHGIHVIDGDADIAWRLWECALVEQKMNQGTTLAEQFSPTNEHEQDTQPMELDYWKVYPGDNL